MSKNKDIYRRKTTENSKVSVDKQAETMINTDKKYLILLMLSVFTVFAVVLGNGFVNWDDNTYIINNPYIKDFSLKGIHAIFSNYYFENYHPLTTLTYLFEYTLYGLNPMPYHLTNLLLHAFNTILLFLFMRNLTGSSLRAFIISLFFAVHPLRVESVAWVSERKDVLFALFYIAAMKFYLAYLDKRRVRYWVLAFSMFILSLLSKSAAVTLPLVLILIYVYKRRQLNLRALVYLTPFFAFSLVFGLIALVSQEKAYTDVYQVFTVFEHAVLVAYCFVFYAFKLFIPINLSTLYGYPYKDASGSVSPEYYLAFVVCIAVPVVLYFIRNKRYFSDVLFGLLFYVVTLVLVVQIYPVGQSLVSDRYAYLPHIGLLFALTALFKIRKEHINPSLKGVLIGVFVVFSLITFQRNRIWKDSITLFTDVIEKNDELPSAYLNRAIALNEAGRINEAESDYTRAISLKGRYEEAFFNRGLLRFNNGRYQEAIADFDSVLVLDNRNADAYSNRAGAMISLGFPIKAIEDLNKAIELKPEHYAPYVNRGNAYAMTEQYDYAIADFNNAEKLGGVNKDISFNRGIMYYKLGYTFEACRDWKLASELGDKDAGSFYQKKCNEVIGQ